MGDKVIDLKEAKFWAERKKIEKKYTIKGKLSQEGINELFKHASKNGKVRELYLPEGYGTEEYEREH